jgi:multiple sugar transport system substrate-binding protein
MKTRSPSQPRLGALLVVLALLATACGPNAGVTPGPGTGSPPAGTPAPSSPQPVSPAPDSGVQPPTTAVTLEFWNPFTGPDGAFMQALVDQFNDETETVQVNVTTQGDYYTVLRTASEEHNLPQVAIMHVDAIPAHARDGIVTPIGDLADQLGLSGTDFTEPVWNGGIFDGERYSIPLDIHTLTFYWNKKLFRDAGLDPESPPTDRESFVSAATAITALGGDAAGYRQISTNNFLAGIVWATLFYQGGGQLTSEDGMTATYNSEAGTQAAEFMRSMIADGISPEGVAGDDEIIAFQQGTSGMVLSGIWETTRYAEALGDDLGAGPVPNIFGQGVWAGSHQLVVPRQETDDANIRQGAYYFIDWISRHSVEWAKGGQIPARASVRESAEFQAIPYISAIAAQADAARFPPAIPAISDLIFGANGAGESALRVVAGEEAQPVFDQSVEQYTQFLQEQAGP